MSVAACGHRAFRTIVSAAVAPVLLLSSSLHAQSVNSVARINGIDLHYRVLGTGPPVLVLHGLAATGAFMIPAVQELASAYTLVIPDLPGHGRSSFHSGPYSYRQVATDMFGLMDRLGFEQFRAIGWSAGGSTLWHMATQQPRRLPAMVIVAGPFRFPPAVRDALRAYPAFDALPTPMRSYLETAHPGGRAQINRLLAAFRDIGSAEVEVSFSAADLASIATRTLLVWGDRDAVAPELALEAYRAIPGAALWIIPDQEHFSLWPAWGGSPAAAAAFPSTVRAFFTAETAPLRRPR